MAYFDGKRAAVTGAGSGIGRALARALNDAGCALWLCDVDGEALAATVDGLPRPEVPCAIATVDVADRAADTLWGQYVIGLLMVGQQYCI